MMALGFALIATLNQRRKKMEAKTKKCWACSGQMEDNGTCYVCHSCGATWNYVAKVVAKTRLQSACDRAKASGIGSQIN